MLALLFPALFPDGAGFCGFAAYGPLLELDLPAGAPQPPLFLSSLPG